MFHLFKCFGRFLFDVKVSGRCRGQRSELLDILMHHRDSTTEVVYLATAAQLLSQSAGQVLDWGN